MNGGKFFSAYFQINPFGLKIKEFLVCEKNVIFVSRPFYSSCRGLRNALSDHAAIRHSIQNLIRSAFHKHVAPAGPHFENLKSAFTQPS